MIPIGIFSRFIQCAAHQRLILSAPQPNCFVAAIAPIRALMATGLFEKLDIMKYDVPNDKPELFKNYYTEIDDAAKKLRAEHIA